MTRFQLVFRRQAQTTNQSSVTTTTRVRRTSTAPSSSTATATRFAASNGWFAGGSPRRRHGSLRLHTRRRARRRPAVETQLDRTGSVDGPRRPGAPGYARGGVVNGREGAGMPRIVATHAVVDIDRWLEGKAERAAAIESGSGSNVVDHVAQDGSNNIAITADVGDLAALGALLRPRRRRSRPRWRRTGSSSRSSSTSRRRPSVGLEGRASPRRATSTLRAPCAPSGGRDTADVQTTPGCVVDREGGLLRWHSPAS